MTPQDCAALHSKAFSALRSWSADEFADLLSRPDTFVAGDVDAFALIRVVIDEAEILTLATDPAKRRRGLAYSVLGGALAQSKSRGAAAVFLEVAEDNEAAIALYRKAGFETVGRRPGYYLPKNAAPIAASVMRRNLDPD